MFDMENARLMLPNCSCWHFDLNRIWSPTFIIFANNAVLIEHLSSIALAWVTFVCAFIAIRCVRFRPSAYTCETPSHKCSFVVKIRCDDMLKRKTSEQVFYYYYYYFICRLSTHSNLWSNKNEWNASRTVSHFLQCDKSICDIQSESAKDLIHRIIFKHFAIHTHRMVGVNKHCTVCVCKFCLLSHEAIA